MRRGSAFALGLALLGCATRPDTCRPDPRYRPVDDQPRGIPDTVFDESAVLLRDIDARPRHCQTLVEGFRWVPHVVWFTSRQSDDVTVVVRFARDDDYSEATADLPWNIARYLARACERFLRDPPPCERAGRDGAFFHVAHHVPRSGYLMRTFWSPRRSSIEGSFQLMIGALRDYVLVPSSMRPMKLHDLWSSVEELERDLDRGRPEPGATLCAEPR